MEEYKSIFADPTLMVIFAFATAGLGHLRVTDALYQGMPYKERGLLLGALDKSVSGMHRFTSLNPLARNIAEWAQYGIGEEVFTKFYRNFLRTHTTTLHDQMMTLIYERMKVAKTILVVATHFGLAHQLAQIKQEIMDKQQVRLYIMLQVTDDSPQHLWYVEGVDIIFVPSEKTKKALQDYASKNNLKPVKFVVSPYPVSPKLTQALSEADFHNKQLQTHFDSHEKINIVLPVSGAAVHVDYYTKIMAGLYQKSPRFFFYVLTRKAQFTQNFINDIADKKYISLYFSTHHREVVQKYDEVYQKNTISLEITKPSEQMFKALLSPKKVGGSIMLLSHPVGRQEYDNVNFLQRHELMANNKIKNILFSLAQENNTTDPKIKKLVAISKSWRAVRIPDDAKKATEFIYWLLRMGFFQKMVEFSETHDFIENKHELGDDGVLKFWQEVGKFLQEQG